MTGTIPTSEHERLRVRLDHPVRTGRAGLFISMGEGTHVRRTLDSFELILVRSGSLGMYEGTRRFDLKAGQALLLWPGREHGGLRPYESDLSFYWAHFTLPKTAEADDPGVVGEDGFYFHVEQLSVPARPDYQRELFHRYLDERERGTLHPAQAALLLTQILFEAARPAESTDTSEHAASLAGRVAAYIEARCNQSLSTSSIARAMGYNEDYLGRVFRGVRGMTITEAIHRSQIKMAKSMLQGSEMNISEIGRHCGFNDPGYFRRVFVSCEGLTPLSYRQMYSRVHINRY